MNILILGANSAMAKHVARIYAERQESLFLVSRDEEKLQALTADLKARSQSKVTYQAKDLADVNEHKSLINEVLKFYEDKLDLVIIAYGVLGDQEKSHHDFAECEKIININFVSALSLSHLVADYFEKKKGGQLVGITSVAGDRGRKKVYIYGAAKAAFTTILSGLRQRLQASNVHVLTVKPGIVDTPMTANLEKGLLCGKSDKVAKDIVKAIDKRKEILYTPWFWYFIMFIIRHIPEKIFKKLNF